jgi:hypothetical protein
MRREREREALEAFHRPNQILLITISWQILLTIPTGVRRKSLSTLSSGKAGGSDQKPKTGVRWPSAS